MGSARKRFWIWTLVLALLCACVPPAAYAEAAQAVYAARSDGTVCGGWRLDPQRMQRVSLSGTSVFRRRVLTQSSNTGTVCTTLEAAARVLREGLIARKSEITLSFPTEAGFDGDDIWRSAMQHNGEAKAGDYLLWQIGALQWSLYRNTVSGTDHYTITYVPDYYTTAAQEEQVDAAVQSLLAQLALDGKSDAQKLRAVYDWLCANVTYDNANLNNSSYVLKFTAYAALIDHTAVCQGYALLLYRLALELGIDARFISGTANGGSHGWNIVRLDGLYYNADAAWDATRKQAGLEYSYYLRGAANFSDHVRDDDYLTPEFVQAYPTDPADYGVTVAWPVGGKCGDALTWSLTAEGVLTVSGTGEMYDYYTQNPGWYDYAWQVRSVVIEDGVTSIGANAFYYCTALENVTVRGKAEIREMAFLHCEALKSISMEHCTAIGDYAFLNCAALASVHIPASVKTIGEQVFRGCTALCTITVAEGSTTYRAQGNILFSKDGTRLLFAGAGLDGQYSVPSGVTQIAPFAFCACAALEAVTLPEGVTNVEEGTFEGCTALRSITLPEGLLSIGDTAFNGCKALTALTLPPLLKTIGYAAFYGCRALQELTIPASVTEIGAEAWCGCDGIKTVRFSGEAPRIGEDAFKGVYAQAYYPDPTVFTSWTIDALNSYGGFLQWTQYSPHDYTAAVTEPSCTEQGYTTYTCTKCGDTYKGNYTAATGHNWDDGVVTKEPTEESTGVRKFTCDKCHTTRTEQIPALDHEHSYTETVTAATCTEGGYTTHICAKCGDSYRDNETPALGHSYGEWTQTVAPSCTKPGEKKRTCSDCEHYEVMQIAATGHDCAVTTVAPTCTAQGYTLHSCNNCDYSYKDAFMSALGHSFTAYQSDGNATCKADGTETALCDHGCGKTDTRTLVGSRLAHSYGEWVTVTAATHEAEGLKRRSCGACGDTQEQTIPRLTGPTQIASTHYTVSDVAVCGVAPGTTVAEFLGAMTQGEYLAVYDGEKQLEPTATVATGMQVRLICDGSVVQALPIAVRGDVNGDGAVSVTDMLCIKAYLLGKSVPDGAAALAADLNSDGTISITDFLQSKAQLLAK